MYNPSNRYDSSFSAAKTITHNISGKKGLYFDLIEDFIATYYDIINLFGTPVLFQKIHYNSLQHLWKVTSWKRGRRGPGSKKTKWMTARRREFANE